MHIAVDMDRLGFLHKHHDHETCSGLSWLECGQQTSVLIENLDSDDFLRSVSHGDLIRLYKNVTGLEPQEHSWGDRAFYFREHLREVARGMDITTALPEEVEVQVDAVRDQLYDGERFKYALGARRPAQAVDLFPMSARALNVAQIKAVEERAKARIAAHRETLERERQGTQPVASKPWEAKALVEAVAVPLVPDNAPRKVKAVTGSVRPVCRGRAEEAWKNRGTDDWKTIKARLMTELEAEGYHPTTIRIKLNEWAKEQGVS